MIIANQTFDFVMCCDKMEMYCLHPIDFLRPGFLCTFEIWKSEDRRFTLVAIPITFGFNFLFKPSNGRYLLNACQFEATN